MRPIVQCRDIACKPPSDGHVHRLVWCGAVALLAAFLRQGGGKPFGALFQSLGGQQVERLVAAAKGFVGELA